MNYPAKKNIPMEEIQNGALLLLLLRECSTWEELCARYAWANPADLLTNTTTMTLRDKLFDMRTLGLLTFADEQVPGGPKPVGQIRETDVASKIRAAFGGMSLSEAAMLSRHSKGMAVMPAFGRPQQPEEHVSVFVLMPFKAKLENVYTGHIRPLGEELGLAIRRADDIFSPRPFMEKVWDGICAAELVLADCTEKNPNVFYEIGMAHTVGRKVVLITRSERDIPSDIRHFDYIHYSPDPEGVALLLDKLRKFLKQYFSL